MAQFWEDDITEHLRWVAIVRYRSERRWATCASSLFALERDHRRGGVLGERTLTG
jgi:hypothetical protein